MKLAFSTNAYLNFSFAEAVRRLAHIGYAGVEIMADVPHAWPAYLLPEHKKAIKRALNENKLAISNINSFMMHAVNDPRQKYWHPSWIEPDPHYRQIRINHTKRALTLAKELGAPCITTEPGGPVAAGESWSAALKLFVDTPAVVITAWLFIALGTSVGLFGAWRFVVMRRRIEGRMFVAPKSN